MWRDLTITTASELRAAYGRTLIMAVRITTAADFGRWSARGTAPSRFGLTASAATREALIRRSGEAIGWRLDHRLLNTAAFVAPELTTLVATNGRAADGVADAIVAPLLS